MKWVCLVVSNSSSLSIFRYSCILSCFATVFIFKCDFLSKMRYQLVSQTSRPQDLIVSLGEHACSSVASSNTPLSPWAVSYRSPPMIDVNTPDFFISFHVSRIAFLMTRFFCRLGAWTIVGEFQDPRSKIRGSSRRCGFEDPIARDAQILTKWVYE